MCETFNEQSQCMSRCSFILHPAAFTVLEITQRDHLFPSLAVALFITFSAPCPLLTLTHIQMRCLPDYEGASSRRLPPRGYICMRDGQPPESLAA